MNTAFFLCHGWHINTSACCTLPPCPAGCRGGTNRDVTRASIHCLEPSLLVVRDTDGCNRYMYIICICSHIFLAGPTLWIPYVLNFGETCLRLHRELRKPSAPVQVDFKRTYIQPFAAKTNWTTEPNISWWICIRNEQQNPAEEGLLMTWTFKNFYLVQRGTLLGTNISPPKMAFWRWFSFSQGGIC